MPARLSRGAGTDRGKGWERGGKPVGQGSHLTQADLTKALSGPGALRAPPVQLSSPLSGGNIWALCTARLTPCWSGWGRGSQPPRCAVQGAWEHRRGLRCPASRGEPLLSLPNPSNLPCFPEPHLLPIPRKSLGFSHFVRQSTSV